MVDVSEYIRPVILPKRSLRLVKTRKIINLDGKFLGPIHEWWAKRAKKYLPVLLVGLLLWRQYYFNGSKNPVKLTGRELHSLDINRQTARRSLAVLEKAGLIRSQKFGYPSPLITIVVKEEDCLE